MEDLREDLKRMIVRHNLESGSGTPDFILGEFLLKCLNAFESAVNERETWYYGPDVFSDSEPLTQFEE